MNIPTQSYFFNKNGKKHYAKYCDACNFSSPFLINITNSLNKGNSLYCCNNYECKMYIQNTVNFIYDSIDSKFNIQKPELFYSIFINYRVFPKYEMKKQNVLNEIINNQINYERLIKSNMIDKKWNNIKYCNIVSVLASWIL